MVYQKERENEVTIASELQGKIDGLKRELDKERKAREAAEAHFSNATRPYALLSREEVLWQVGDSYTSVTSVTHSRRWCGRWATAASSA